MVISEYANLTGSLWGAQTLSKRANSISFMDELLTAGTLSSNAAAIEEVPSFLTAWAQKYNVDIYQESIPLGEYGGSAQAYESTAPRVSVYIDPKMVQRMMNDVNYAKTIETKLALMAGGMNNALRAGTTGQALKGASITIHEDGSISAVLYAQKEDDWAKVEALMEMLKKLCEEIHQAIVEKIEKQDELALQQRATSECLRIQHTSNNTPEAEAELEARLLRSTVVLPAF